MKIVIAPQAFKGCASAHVIASTIAAGVHRAFPNAQLVIAPVADGGDDTLEILLATKGGERHHSQTWGPFGESKSVYWGGLTNAFPKTAVIESARICGLANLEKNKRDPLLTSTYGIGALMNQAMQKDFRRLFIGLGGSATNDAGVGLAQALGVRFLDSKGNDLPKGGGSLINLSHIDTSRLNPFLEHVEVIAGCDVINPLLGPNGSSKIFSPQKGASKKVADQLEAGMLNFAKVVKKEFDQDLSTIPYLGAAGGTPACLLLFCDASLVSGARWILNEIGFDKIIEDADLVITGEGCIDLQTASEKAPMIVAEAAKKRGIPVIAIVGTSGPGADSLKGKGFDAIFMVSPNASVIPANALQLLQKTAERSVREFLAS
ncbi:MAG TPA: glycerate kinase [Parachlamydiaceae bacterium]|nr:glycerate kinase [Parachlamydiaceae bacterium]